MNIILKNIQKLLANKKFVFIVKIILAIIIITALVKKISFQQITEVYHHARTGFIIAAAGMLVLNIFFQYKRWALLVRLVKPETTRLEIFASLMAGSALGFITPGRVGEFSRSLFIKGADFSSFAGLIFLDKLFALAVIYLFGIFGLFYFIQLFSHHYVWMPLEIALLALLFVFMFLILHPDLIKMILVKYLPGMKTHKRIGQFVSVFNRFKAVNARYLLLYAALHYLTYVTQFYLLILAFSSLSMFNGFLAVTAILMLKTLAPVSIGDLGIRESAAIFFLNEFSVSRAAAFNASFLLFVINILIPACVGMVFLFINRKSTRKGVK